MFCSKLTFISSFPLVEVYFVGIWLGYYKLRNCWLIILNGKMFWYYVFGDKLYPVGSTLFVCFSLSSPNIYMACFLV